MGDAARPQQLKLPLVPLEETIDVWTAARIARVSPETIRRWCDAGLFPSWKLVGRWKVERAGFYNFLTTCQSSFRTK
jgi:hypothetical protein